jgi:4-hydroxy-2-oxoheptanedioate aldolase
VADLPINRFKRALIAGQPQIGLWLSLTSPIATEIVAGAGFDWLLIDMEHAANDLSEVAAHLRAAEGGTAEPIVRPPWNDTIMVKRLLDLGVRTLLFPFIQTAREAASAVAATRYPPSGIRGIATATRANRYGRVMDYPARAGEEICVLLEIETRSATKQIEAIAAVDGVDGLFVARSDLAADMGHLGRPSAAAVHAAVLAAGTRIRAAGKPAGYLSDNEQENRAILKAGFSFVAVGSDVAILARQSEALAASYRI